MRIVRILCAAGLVFAAPLVGVSAGFAVTSCPADCVLSGTFCYCKLPMDTIKVPKMAAPKVGDVCHSGKAEGKISVLKGARICAIQATTFNTRTTPQPLH
jgi:hypothetical protein